VADFLSDVGTRDVAGAAGSTVLATLLKQASGEVEAACLKGNRYRVADLQALTGNSLEMLRGLVAALALGLLVRRRPDLRRGPFPQAEEARQELGRLAAGEAIFGLQEVADAGEASHEAEDAADVEARNLSSYQARRFFGRRGNRLGR
jgi:hypothetical protein